MKTPAIIATTLLVIALAAPAQAQLRKCTARNGKVTYSDVACPNSTQSERSVETDGNTLDSSALRDKIQKDKAAAAQAEIKERERSALVAEAAHQEGLIAEKDAVAYANCVRDVESQAPAEDIKAELFAACRTAGSSQRQTGMTPAALRECIQNVERTRVFGKDKARQLATCHGADVKPEPAVIVVPAVRFRPPKISACDATQCMDDKGRRYTRQGALLLRDDGKNCHTVGNNTVQCK